MPIHQAVDLHSAVEQAVNTHDLEALVALYEADARMVAPDGSTADGVDSIREQWQSILALGGRMTLTTRYSVEVGDVALLRNDWTLQADDMSLSSSTAEVARRQPDGTWRYAIDHPFGSSDVIS